MIENFRGSKKGIWYDFYNMYATFFVLVKVPLVQSIEYQVQYIHKFLCLPFVKLFVIRLAIIENAWLMINNEMNFFIAMQWTFPWEVNFFLFLDE